MRCLFLRQYDGRKILNLKLDHDRFKGLNFRIRLIFPDPGDQEIKKTFPIEFSEKDVVTFCFICLFSRWEN